MKVGRRETEDGRPETEDGRQETGDRRKKEEKRDQKRFRNWDFGIARMRLVGF